MGNVFNTRASVVERTREIFVEHVSVGGKVRRIDFEEEILWLRESNTQMSYIHGGRVLSESGLYSDFHDFLTFADGESNAAEAMASSWGITPDSSLVAELKIRVYLSPVISTDETKAWNNRNPRCCPQYERLPSNWRKEINSPYDEGKKIFPQLEDKILTDEVVWSSKNTREENMRKANSFILKWSDRESEKR